MRSRPLPVDLWIRATVSRMPITRIIDPVHPDEASIREMAGLLGQGGLVVFPTETFYGLGSHALRPEALARVYELKGRAGHLPLLCLIDDWSRLDQLVSEIPPWARRLMEAFWPGPLTLVLPPKDNLPDSLLGPTGGVALRWSPHPVALGLAAALQAPIVGTSANPSGRPPAAEIRDLDVSIARGVQGILDAGRTPGGVPSTVLDCMRWPATILRDGAIRRETIAAILEQRLGDIPLSEECRRT